MSTFLTATPTPGPDDSFGGRAFAPRDDGTVVGVGIDVVEIDRLSEMLVRTPALLDRLLTPTERSLSAASRAARVAAKEAVGKALGAPGDFSWQDVTVERTHVRRPYLRLRGATLRAAEQQGVVHLHLSLSHDGDVATAIVVAEREAAAGGGNRRRDDGRRDTARPGGDVVGRRRAGTRAPALRLRQAPSMIRAHTAQAVREAEAPLLTAGEPLMARAARALADRVADRLRVTDRDRSAAADRVLVLAGAGANGGDGLHAAALLRGEGIAADAIATADGLHEEGAAALRAAGGTITALADTAPGMLEEQLATTTVVLDAMLGLGGRPEVPAALTPLLAVVRASGVPVIAVDLPSFVDATTGEAAPEALVARETVTFGAYKAGLLLPGGAERSGTIHLVDIGLAPHLRAAPTVCRLEDVDVRALFPSPHRDASKYTRGVVALAAGSERFPGAAVLAGSGAARTGAGMVRVLAPQAVLDLVLRERPEVVGHRIERADGGPHAIDLDAVGRTDALVVGPGLAPDDARARCGVELLCSDRPDEHAPDRTVIDHAGLARGVIDAGALSVLTPAHRFGPDVVLTPHRGEAERLAERLDLDPELPGVQLAPALAGATGATVLLKGAVTLIAPGDGGPLRAQDDATAQLATAGTGDVLAGVLGTLLAAGLTGPDAAALAAILHGRAGRLASHDGRQPLVALDVAAHLPETIGTILAGAQP